MQFSNPPRQTRAERLARALVRDRETRSAQRINQASAPACMTCGRAYAGRASRFCSTRCREAYDNGFPVFAPPDPSRYYTLPISGTGFCVACAHCARQFSSHGLRCCSSECERALCQRQARDRELAGDPFRSPRPPCEHCGSPIPRWRNGRQVPATARFCSDRCRKQHHRKFSGRATRSPVLPPSAIQPDLGRQTANWSSSNGVQFRGGTAPLVVAGARP
jgi:hypothetical protein